MSPDYLRSAHPPCVRFDLKAHTLIESTGGRAEYRSTWPGFSGRSGSRRSGRSKLKFDFTAQTSSRRKTGRAWRWGTYGADVFMSGDLVRPLDGQWPLVPAVVVVSGAIRWRSEVRAFVD